MGEYPPGSGGLLVESAERVVRVELAQVAVRLNGLFERAWSTPGGSHHETGQGCAGCDAGPNDQIPLSPLLRVDGPLSRIVSVSQGSVSDGKQGLGQSRLGCHGHCQPGNGSLRQCRPRTRLRLQKNQTAVAGRGVGVLVSGKDSGGGQRGACVGLEPAAGREQRVRSVGPSARDDAHDKLT